MEMGVKVRCQRIGCDTMFSEDDNTEGSCRYHHSGPIFHDGMKEWSCCKKRSHDFSLFLQIPGCMTGKHTTEKQVAAPVKKSTMPPPTVTPSTNASSKDSCSRCRQGFFCSDHGSQSKPVNIVGDKSVNLAGDASAVNNSSVQAPKPPKKIVDINEPQVCKNKGCGQTFKEKDNHDTACSYHPGPAVFHDRMRGWKCCDIHVKEFDEFMSIPPCSKGWHNADPES
ncbi:cysteine and histidine-rich domain-containing protein RAR1 [Abrus precatorius]|uniref:Cysteine and histidine-rich domain-containing protein RAR1 n=1 Tax=Abrus precatorius TaxID=3816 RepID=A0A8B8M8X6_ABRPR|nr:cysteine and histidine-rich domain-containing protein RAR1 [Abrus precatorius]XP_027365142.1 cysteine and histidine-rich domain-containing protein RAR1 [Abrus precatorius]